MSDAPQESADEQPAEDPTTMLQSQLSETSERLAAAEQRWAANERFIEAGRRLVVQREVNDAGGSIVADHMLEHFAAIAELNATKMGIDLANMNDSQRSRLRLSLLDAAHAMRGERKGIVPRTPIRW